MKFYLPLILSVSLLAACEQRPIGSCEPDKQPGCEEVLQSLKEPVPETELPPNIKPREKPLPTGQTAGGFGLDQEKAVADELLILPTQTEAPASVPEAPNASDSL